MSLTIIDAVQRSLVPPCLHYAIPDALQLLPCNADAPLDGVLLELLPVAEAKLPIGGAEVAAYIV